MESRLREGARALEVDLSDAQFSQLLAYAELLQKWGKVYNLTAVRGESDVLTHHLLDSLAVVAPLRKWGGSQLRTLLDVGSGAGLPGVVIAVACPDIRVDCVDAVAKKAAFIQQVAGALKLPNLRGLHARVEQLGERYDVATSRAFASLADFVALSRAAVRERGAWMAMKGKFPGDEIAQLPPDIEMFHVEQLQVPGLDAERCIVWLRRARP
jgi:16S rRNA (guanine527-N7)-methyltransferase